MVVTRAEGLEEADRLRRCGQRLATVAHPGVVQLVSSGGDERRWELVTTHAGRPIDAAPGLTPAQVAHVLSQVATTLADLHDLHCVHGRLAARHILLGPEGRPTLCGFGPEAPEGACPADDVAALGRIVPELVAADQPVEPIPERRWSRRRRWDGWARATLLTIADQACAEPPSRRPTARRLAASLADAFSEATPPAHVQDAGPPGDDRIGTRLRLAAAGLVVVAASPAVVGALTGGAPVASPEERGAVDTVDTVDIDDIDDVAVEGRVVSVGSQRWEVGQPGDVVTVGDWDCDGIVTPAVLRPTTGEVFVFERWADQEQVARPVAAAPGAVRIGEVGGPDGCSSISATSSDGDTVPVVEVER